MTKRSPFSYAAMVLALSVGLLLGIGAGGFADAAGHKIGKNLVVTKSIKNGAVTGKKVKDGTLTAADVAPGTFAAPGGSKSVVVASIASSPVGGGATTAFAPSGSFQAGESTIAVAPVAMVVSDLRVFTDQTQAAGQSFEISIESGPVLGTTTRAMKCVVPPGGSTCATTEQLTLPAGHVFFVRLINGGGGAAGGLVTVGYTVRVP